MSAATTSPKTRSRKPWSILFLIVAILLVLGLIKSKNSFGGSESSNSERTSNKQSNCSDGSLTLRAGEEAQTVWGTDLRTGHGCAYTISSTGSFVVFSSGRELPSPRGLCGSPSGGMIRIRAEENITIRFRFVGLVTTENRC